MKLFPVFLFFAISVPLFAQVQADSDSLLRGASNALDHYQRLAPSFHCESAQKTEFRNACAAAVQTLGERVQEAKTEIARYRQQPTHQPVDLVRCLPKFSKSFRDPGRCELRRTRVLWRTQPATLRGGLQFLGESQWVVRRRGESLHPGHRKVSQPLAERMLVSWCR